MHIYFITRGIKQDVDRFIRELSSKYLPFMYKGKKAVVQNALRPIQLWEMVFPEGCKNEMLSTVFGDSKTFKVTQHKKHKKWLSVIRKVLGVKPIPNEWEFKPLPVYRQNMETAGIGIKEDYKFEDGTEGL